MDEQMLHYASLFAVERFARWLGVNVPPRTGESLGLYRRRLVFAILRHLKRQKRQPR